MWRDICLENKDAILSSLKDFQQDLSGLKKLIETGDDKELVKLFANAKKVRDRNI